MPELSIAFIISSFVAGLLTFLAPCTLPLVPGYLAFISGVNQKDLTDPLKAHETRKKIFINGLFFVIGFTFVFVVFGILAEILGQVIAPWRLWFTRIGGLFVILFGLLMLGVLKIPFLALQKNIKIPRWITLGKPSSSLIIGGTFAFGWTPCVGPILGSILLLASGTSTTLQGAFLLLVFSLGLALPFLILARAFSHATEYIKSIEKYLRGLNIVGGLFLIVVGILLMSNNFGIIVQYGFELFKIFNYEAILKYL